MVFPIVGGDGKPTGYEVENSLRFAYGDSPKLQRRVSSTGSNKVGTFSIWFKRGAVRDSNNLYLFSAHEGSQNYINVGINDEDKFLIRAVRDNSEALKYRTNALFRDHSAFYNVVFSLDTAESDGNNAMKLYINGALQDAYSISTYTQDMEIMFNLNANYIRVGAANDDSEPFDGYISEMHYVDGTVKQASDFGEYNDNGVWIPKEYEGTYGTNGFYLEFKQSGVGSGSTSTVGADTSGNTNHFDSTNLAATDVTTDTPTNNFCTLNPLAKGSSVTLSEGNLKYVPAETKGTVGTFGLTKGKWYWEIKAVDVGSNTQIGLYDGTDGNGFPTSYLGVNSSSWGVISNDGNTIHNGSQASYGSSFSDNDILQVALDMDNGKWYVGKNGTYFNSGNPATSTNPAHTGIDTGTGTIFPSISNNNTTGVDYQFNFGNAPFSISSGNADANGYGNFEYAVPSGYYALNTKNLAEFG